MIVSAPGKIVLWGEYAVLAGAPAAVMAVNRRALVLLERTQGTRQFTSQGFLTPGIHKASSTFSNAPAAAIAETILRLWGYNELPENLAVHSDSRAFHDARGNKLGLGSSAAVCTATYIALTKWLNRPAIEAEAIAAHRAFQGGHGSGLDVAASWHGGIIRFSQGSSTPWSWPADLYWQVVWTRRATITQDSLADFHVSDHSVHLERLSQSATSLFKSPDLAGLSEYVDRLKSLDVVAGLNIFTPEHCHLNEIAQRYGLLYKPCGAGGGDIGLACGEDPGAVQDFARAAAAGNFIPLDLEIAQDGVTPG